MLDRPTAEVWADNQVQTALKVLSDHHAREWEASRTKREANIRRQLADWQFHLAGCLERIAAYEAEAATLPKAHKHHSELLRLAADQREKAAFAKRWIENLEDEL